MEQVKVFPWLVNDTRTITPKTNKRFIYISCTKVKDPH